MKKKVTIKYESLDSENWKKKPTMSTFNLDNLLRIRYEGEIFTTIESNKTHLFELSMLIEPPLPSITMIELQLPIWVSSNCSLKIKIDDSNYITMSKILTVGEKYLDSVFLKGSSNKNQFLNCITVDITKHIQRKKKCNLQLFFFFHNKNGMIEIPEDQISSFSDDNNFGTIQTWTYIDLLKTVWYALITLVNLSAILIIIWGLIHSYLDKPYWWSIIIAAFPWLGSIPLLINKLRKVSGKSIIDFFKDNFYVRKTVFSIGLIVLLPITCYFSYDIIEKAYTQNAYKSNIKEYLKFENENENENYEQELDYQNISLLYKSFNMIPWRPEAAILISSHMYKLRGRELDLRKKIDLIKEIREQIIPGINKVWKFKSREYVKDGYIKKIYKTKHYYPFLFHINLLYEQNFYFNKILEKEGCENNDEYELLAYKNIINIKRKVYLLSNKRVDKTSPLTKLIYLVYRYDLFQDEYLTRGIIAGKIDKLLKENKANKHIKTSHYYQEAYERLVLYHLVNFVKFKEEDSNKRQSLEKAISYLRETIRIRNNNITKNKDDVIWLRIPQKLYLYKLFTNFRKTKKRIPKQIDTESIKNILTYISDEKNIKIFKDCYLINPRTIKKDSLKIKDGMTKDEEAKMADILNSVHYYNLLNESDQKEIIADTFCSTFGFLKCSEIKSNKELIKKSVDLFNLFTKNQDFEIFEDKKNWFKATVLSETSDYEKEIEDLLKDKEY